MGKLNGHDEFAYLEEENARLKRAIDKLTTPPVRILGMTPIQSRIVGAVYNHPLGISKQALYDAIYWDRPDGGPDPQGLSVQLCNVRKVLRQHGISIDTVWGSGLLMTEPNRKRLAIFAKSVNASLPQR